MSHFEQENLNTYSPCSPAGYRQRRARSPTPQGGSAALQIMGGQLVQTVRYALMGQSRARWPAPLGASAALQF